MSIERIIEYLWRRWIQQNLVHVSAAGVLDVENVTDEPSLADSIQRAVAQDSGMKLFLSNKQSDMATEKELGWMENKVFSSVKYSLNPYNGELKLNYSQHIKPNSINVEVFGPRLFKAIVDFFDNEAIKTTAFQVGIPFPDFEIRIDDFIQQKQEEKVIPCFKKVLGKDLVGDERGVKCPAAFEQSLEINDQDRAVLERMLELSQEFVKLGKATISMQQWHEFIGKYANPDWDKTSMLDYHKGFLNKVFGLGIDLTNKLTWDAKEDSDPKTPDEWWTAFPLESGQLLASAPLKKKIVECGPTKWLNKILSAGYGPKGCFTDVVNLAYHIMQRDLPEDKDETAAPLIELKSKMESRDLSHLWIPSHFAMDGEMDDVLCWAILETLNKMSSPDPGSFSAGQIPKLQLLIHLPKNEIGQKYRDKRSIKTGDATSTNIQWFFEDPKQKFHERVQVFRDPDASNYKALALAWDSVKYPKSKPKVEAYDPKGMKWWIATYKGPEWVELKKKNQTTGKNMEQGYVGVEWESDSFSVGIRNAEKLLDEKNMRPAKFREGPVGERREVAAYDWWMPAGNGGLSRRGWYRAQILGIKKGGYEITWAANYSVPMAARRTRVLQPDCVERIEDL